MRRFSAGYLEDTRRGMWEDRSALEGLDLGARRRILDVGCGTGEFTRVLREESGGPVVGIDADGSLLDHAGTDGSVVGDARRLPFDDGAFDLVACQALLINLPDPAVVVREFARVSSDLVAAVEPDNAAVQVDSTVRAEPRLARRARAAYLDELEADAALGADAADLLRGTGLSDVTVRRHDLVRRIEPPYTERAVESARRKARATRIRDARETLSDGMDEAEYDDLRTAWRSMGRDVVEQMSDGEYERTETVPFYVAVGSV